MSYKLKCGYCDIITLKDSYDHYSKDVSLKNYVTYKTIKIDTNISNDSSFSLKLIYAKTNEVLHIFNKNHLTIACGFPGETIN